MGVVGSGGSWVTYEKGFATVKLMAMIGIVKAGILVEPLATSFSFETLIFSCAICTFTTRSCIFFSFFSLYFVVFSFAVWTSAVVFALSSFFFSLVQIVFRVGSASFKIRTSSLIVGIFSSALSPSSCFKFDSNSLNRSPKLGHSLMDASGAIVGESLCLFFLVSARALAIPSTVVVADEAVFLFSLSASISLLFSAISSFAFLISVAGSSATVVGAGVVGPVGAADVGPVVASHWSSMVAGFVSTALKQYSSPASPSLL